MEGLLADFDQARSVKGLKRSTRIECILSNVSDTGMKNYVFNQLVGVECVVADLGDASVGQLKRFCRICGRIVNQFAIRVVNNTVFIREERLTILMDVDFLNVRASADERDGDFEASERS